MENSKTQNTKKRTFVAHCPCGGGQSCMVDRRERGDFVIVDNVMKKAGVPLLINCADKGTAAQQKAWNDYMTAFDAAGYNSVRIS